MLRSALLASMLVLAPCASSAQEDLRTQARAQYERARELDASGRTAEALPFARRAHRLFPSAGARYAVALLHERLAERDEAIRQYRMALAEPVQGDAALTAAIGAGLSRLGGPVEPLAPEPLPNDDAAVEVEPPHVVEPTVPVAPIRQRILRISTWLLTDAAHIDRAWAFAIGVGAISSEGLFADLTVTAPHLAVVLQAGVEPTDWMVRPLLAVFAGMAPLRSVDAASFALFVGPRLGVAVHPLPELGLSFVASAGVAFELTRTEGGVGVTVPVELGARWAP